MAIYYQSTENSAKSIKLAFDSNSFAEQLKSQFGAGIWKNAPHEMLGGGEPQQKTTEG